MDVLSTIWIHVLSIFSFIAPYLKGVLTSNLFGIILTAALATYVGVRTFLTQQRVSRTQKIYYEESLLDQLKHMDNSINAAAQSYSIFLSSMNLITNNIDTAGRINSLIINSLTDLATQIKYSPSYLSSKREVLILLFGKKGYIAQQWLFKFDRDINEFNAFIREILLRFRTENALTQNQLQNQITEVTNNFELVRRHFTLPYLLNEIVSIVGIYDFKSRNSLIYKIKKDPQIIDSLHRLDEAFKIVFGWFSLSNNEYLSYMTDSSGNRFLLRLDQPEITRTQRALPDMSEMRIILNDIRLMRYRVTVNEMTIPFSTLQIGIANYTAFKEMPHFYPEARSFENFTLIPGVIPV